MKLVLSSLALTILKVMLVFCTESSALGCMHPVCAAVFWGLCLLSGSFSNRAIKAESQLIQISVNSDQKMNVSQCDVPESDQSPDWSVCLI